MSDAPRRRAAVQPQRSVIVQAPAGSGKTTLLVERYLRLLELVEAPEEILAITFTRKAAAEMKARILRFLDPAFTSDASHEQDALAVARRLAPRVAAWGLAENPQRLLIRTIDSFSHYLARSMPVASGLGPTPAPVEDATPSYRQAARRVLAVADDGADALAADLERLLLWRDHRTQDLENLLVSMLARREQWLRALAVAEPEREALEGVLDELVRDRLAAARRALAGALAEIGCATGEVAALMTFAAGTLRTGAAPSPILDWPGGDDLPDARADALPAWRALGEALLTAEGRWRSARGVNKRQGFPSRTREKGRVAGILLALADHAPVAALLDQARRLPVPRYGDDQWSVLAALLRVLKRAASELALVFAEAAQTDFTGLSAAALTALGDVETGITDLGLYLDRRIRHVLVDEYQDTNWAQFRLLEKLTDGWEPGDGRTLFVVGDPMQSIYRFREAEVGLFMRTRDHGLGPLTLEPLLLQRNFRAREELVHWVNERLGPAFPSREDVAAGAVAFVPSQAGRGGGGGVEVHALPDEHTEAEVIARTLEQALSAHADDADWRAAIIVRARSHLRAILPALKRRQLPYRAVRLDPLEARPAVQDLLCLTRAIRLPGDTAALLATLRAPWCGLTLADLHALAGDGADPRGAAALMRLEPPARARAERVFAALEGARASVGRRSLRDRVEGAWHRLGGPWCLAGGAGDLADARQYLGLLEQAEADGLLDDLNDFAERLSAGFTAGDPPSEAVRLEVLTMHGAKGLEWDLVVLPQLNRGSRGQDRELLHWLPFTREDGDEQVLLAPLRAAEESEDEPLVTLIGNEQKQREAFEHQRLLYVAATRARERLLLTTTLEGRENGAPEPRAGTLLELLWPQCGDEFSAALHRAANDGDAPAAPRVGRPDQSLRRVPDGWSPAIGPRLAWAPALPQREREVEIEFDWAGVQARRTGTVIHALLERVGRIGIERLSDDERAGLVQRIPRLLKALGTGQAALQEASAIVEEAFTGTLDSEIGRWILSGRHVDAACERPLTGLVDGQLVNAVIDRTFVDADGVRWIIDYKSGHHAGGDLEHFLAEEAARYRDQLVRYRRLFEQLDDEREIRVALHFPRHGVLREVDTPPPAA